MIVDLVLEVEYVGGVDVEFSYFFFVGGYGDEMLGDCCFVVECC